MSLLHKNTIEYTVGTFVVAKDCNTNGRCAVYQEACASVLDDYTLVATGMTYDNAIRIADALHKEYPTGF